ncbi:HipA domain-containing protein, partial [Pantoea sp. CTOTU49201]|uniref:HipA domain-containing protein n=1 Tax=Pantoea sp. CTOTU49201 TaxID=2953855 RepID=UPI0028A2D263
VAVERGTLQWAFGRLIANSDMHAGNLSFFTDDERFSLTPAYDMLPMALAPNSQGHMRDEVKLSLDFSLPGAVWRAASAMAKIYWQAIAEDAAFSANFRSIAGQALQQLEAMDVMLHKMA